MGVYNATVITTAGQNLIADAIAGGEAVNFSSLKTSTHVYPAGTSLQNLTALDDVKQSVSPTSVDVYNNNVVQVSARVPNTGIATAYLINTIGLFGQVSGGTETLIAVLTAVTPDEVPEFDPESPAAFIFNVQMTIQNADTVTFEVNDSGTATVADLNRVAQTFGGATASAAGTVGRVPAPAAGADGKFLRGDATWAAPADMVENFTSSDVVDGSATTWTSVSKLDSGENNASIFAKVSQMFKNVRYLYKMLGTTDISAIGNGTVTNALSVLNAKDVFYHTLRSVDVLLANPTVMSKERGNAYAFMINEIYALLFFTLEIKTTTQREALSSVMRFRIDGKIANIQQPYNIPCIVNNNDTLLFCGYLDTQSQGRFITTPVTWNANNTFRISGVAFAQLVSV